MRDVRYLKEFVKWIELCPSQRRISGWRWDVLLFASFREVGKNMHNLSRFFLDRLHTSYLGLVVSFSFVEGGELCQMPGLEVNIGVVPVIMNEV